MEYNCEDFHLIEILGSGSQAEVWLGINIKTQEKVSIKIPKGHNLFDVNILMRLPKSKYLLDYLGYTKKGWIISKYIKGHDLFTFYEKDKLASLSRKDMINMMIEIASALEVLHSHDIYHLDIKPENILIHDDGITLIDYGFCQLAGQLYCKCRLTASYGAPEMLARGGHPFFKDPITEKTDIYSLGVVFHFMSKLKIPFYACSVDSYSAKIKNLEKIPGDNIHNLIVKMMNIDPHKRPSLSEIIEKLKNI